MASKQRDLSSGLPVSCWCHLLAVPSWIPAVQGAMVRLVAGMRDTEKKEDISTEKREVEALS